MAKKRVSTAEPVDGGYEGGSTGRIPENRSDDIIMGMPLPMVYTAVGGPDTPLRRDFNEPTRNPLHFNDGPGTDENVTSRRPKMTAAHGNVHLTVDHDDVRPIQGENKQPYSAGEDEERTLNGAVIYGT